MMVDDGPRWSMIMIYNDDESVCIRVLLSNITNHVQLDVLMLNEDQSCE